MDYKNKPKGHNHEATPFQSGWLRGFRCNPGPPLSGNLEFDAAAFCGKPKPSPLRGSHERSRASALTSALRVCSVPYYSIAGYHTKQPFEHGPLTGAFSHQRNSASTDSAASRPRTISGRGREGTGFSARAACSGMQGTWIKPPRIPGNSRLM